MMTFFLFFICFVVQGQTWRELNKKGFKSYKSGDIKTAIFYFEKALKIYVQEVSNSDNNYSTLINNIAFMYDELGNYKKAESLYLESLEITKKMSERSILIILFL